MTERLAAGSGKSSTRSLVITMTGAGALVEFIIMASFDLLALPLSDLAEGLIDAASLACSLGLVYYLAQLYFRPQTPAGNRLALITSLALAIIVATVEIAIHPILDVVGSRTGPMGVVLADTLVITVVVPLVVAWFDVAIQRLETVADTGQSHSRSLWGLAIAAILSVVIFASMVNSVPGVGAMIERQFEAEFRNLQTLSARQRSLALKIGGLANRMVGSGESLRSDVAELMQTTELLTDGAFQIETQLKSLANRYPQMISDKSGSNDLIETEAQRKVVIGLADALVGDLSGDKHSDLMQVFGQLRTELDTYVSLQEAMSAHWMLVAAQSQANRDSVSVLWFLFSPLALLVIGMTTLGPVALIIRAQEAGLSARADRYERMMAAIGHAQSAIVLMDAEGRVAWANPAVWTLLGLPGKDTIGRPFVDLLADCQAPGPILNDIRAVQDNKRALKTQLRLTALTGKSRQIDIEMQIADGVRGLDGGYVAILTDVTELDTMRNFLRSVFDSVAQGIVIFRQTGEIIDANPAAEDLLELPREKLIGQRLDHGWTGPGADAAFIKPTELPWMRAANMADPVTDAVLSLNRTGRDRLWLTVDANPGVDPASGSRIVIASFSDITKDRNREAELRQARDDAERSLSELGSYKIALDQHAIVSVTDAKGVITHANDGFVAISGYSREELLGANHSIVNSRQHDPAFFAGMWRTIKAGKPWRAEICNKSKSGDFYWVDSTVIPVIESNGDISSFVSIRYDITARVKAQDELLNKTALAAHKSQQLEMTLAHMKQGISAHDADGRVTIFNQCYTDMFGLSEEDMTPGVRLVDLLNLQKERGNFEGDPLELVVAIQTAIRDNIVLENITELKDGRLIKTIHSPTSEGGHVSTHEDVTEREQAAARVLYASRHDILTGLANRVDLRHTVSEALERLGQKDEAFSVLLVDLDRFKAVNDTFGHAVGDKLLQKVAERMQAHVRQTDMVARLGGDEFAIYFGTEPDQFAATTNVAERIRAELCQPYDIDGRIVSIGASIGAAIAPDHGISVDELFRNADLALYHVKTNGRQAIRIFGQDLEHAARDRREIENDLSMAIARNEFELHYQPYHAVGTGEMAGLESLIRWKHPIRGFVPPDVFIPIAEDTDLIISIGNWVIAQAIADATRLPDHVKIAINVSARQFGHGDLVDTITRELISSRMRAERLEVEVTETVLLRDDPVLLDELSRLKAMNISIALDDFGTGYSSLKHLKMFPFDKIKIDRSFVSDMERNTQSSAIVGSLASLARSLDMRVTAEGVETADQLQLLAAAGCTFAQGYFLARPMPLADVYAYLDRTAAKPERRRRKARVS